MTSLEKDSYYAIVDLKNRLIYGTIKLFDTRLWPIDTVNCFRAALFII